VEFNSSVVSKVEIAEAVYVLGKQPAVMSVASESGRPGLGLCLTVKRIPQKTFHRASEGEVLRLARHSKE